MGSMWTFGLGVMLIVALFFLVMLAQLASRRFGIAET